MSLYIILNFYAYKLHNQVWLLLTNLIEVPYTVHKQYLLHKYFVYIRMMKKDTAVFLGLEDEFVNKNNIWL